MQYPSCDIKVNVPLNGQVVKVSELMRKVLANANIGTAAHLPR